MTMRSRTTAAVAAAVLVTVLGGCGGSDDPDPDADTPPTETVDEGKRLVEVCPEVEAAVIAADSDTGDDAVLLTTLNDLSDAADQETQNALSGLIEAVEVMADAEGVDIIDAQDGYSIALDGLADRCEAVGSSALQ